MSYIYNLTDTWNAAGTTFAGIKMAVTNTASDANSKLLELSVSGATTASFSVDKSGNLALSGVAVFSAGTNTAPSITTTGDTNTGVYFPAADTLGFVTNGAERMRLGGPSDATPGGVVVNTNYAFARFNVTSIGDPSTSGATTVGSSFNGQFASSLNLGATIDGGWINAAYANNAAVGLDIKFMSAGVEKARITSTGNVVVNTAAVATNATNGFLYVPGCAGTPTGTPTSYAGRVPIVVDTTNNKLYFYSGGAWRDAGP